METVCLFKSAVAEANKRLLRRQQVEFLPRISPTTITPPSIFLFCDVDDNGDDVVIVILVQLR
jgi:hypothetical protein